MKKVMHPGMIKPEWTRVSMAVFITVDTTREYLSITGVEGPNRHGGCRGACGQIDMHLKPIDFTALAKGWSRAKLETLWDVWDKWHLKPINEVPAAVLEFLETLPESDRQSPWGA